MDATSQNGSDGENRTSIEKEDVNTTQESEFHDDNNIENSKMNTSLTVDNNNNNSLNNGSDHTGNNNSPDHNRNLETEINRSVTASPMNEEKSIRRELSPSDFLFGVTLGEGSYARVVHARMKRPNTPDMAIKIMEKAHIKKENKVKYVMMEKTILSKVSHPFIVKFYFSFQDASSLYMCMDLAPGGELLSVINMNAKQKQMLGLTDQACDEKMVQFYASEITLALEYLHENEVIHRDIKPENILISAAGHIKVADFGTALLGSDEESSRNSFVGTAEYVSPEVLRDEEVTAACDLWALGCMIYQLLTGNTPFRAASEYLTFQRILAHVNESDIEFPSHVSAKARDLIVRLLSPKCGDRLGAGTETSEHHSYKALKRHDYFESVNWESALDTIPPFIPDSSKFPDSSLLRDGVDNDWKFDGGRERTSSSDSIENSFTVTSDHHTSIRLNNNYTPPNHDKSPSASSVRGSYFTRGSNKPSRPVPTYVRNPSNLIDTSQFLDENENNVFTGIVLKRVGLFSKKRQLILSDKPRLLYFDTETMEVKGIIPWTMEHPVRCETINDTAFDILCTKSGRRYHMTAVDSGSAMWVDLINAMLITQQERQHGLKNV